MHTDQFLPAVEPGMTFHNPLIKDRVTFLETADSSDGQRTLVRVDLAPGGGNPLHWHERFTETFSPVEGTLGIQLEDRTLTLEPGEQATAPRGKRHRFFNPSATRAVSFQVELRPASAGFERCMAYAYGLADEGRTTKQGVPSRPADLAILAYWGDTYMPGPMGLVMRLLRGWGRSLVRKDHHRARLERYLALARQRRAEGLAA
ncbi:MAG: cupin domain-containing protein [Flavobacteriales bacterium]|nr:cupin domain-containing protein [Flavobacteriales bacterium]